MAAVSARERLTRLVDLASQSGSEARRELVNELADLLLEWPAAYPTGMREPFEALLERALRDVGCETRASLAERFAANTDTPLAFLNLLLFDATPEVRNAILLRNAAGCEASADTLSLNVNERMLLLTVRKTEAGERHAVLASGFNVSEDIAARILSDMSGTMLAVLCRGANVGRATFSALAVLALPLAGADENYRRLAAYDAVPQEGGTALLNRWRMQVRAPALAAEAA